MTYWMTRQLAGGDSAQASTLTFLPIGTCRDSYRSIVKSLSIQGLAASPMAVIC